VDKQLVRNSTFCLLVSVDWWEGIVSKGEGGKTMECEQIINVYTTKRKKRK
jgi:hypothetical protein